MKLWTILPLLLVFGVDSAFAQAPLPPQPPKTSSQSRLVGSPPLAQKKDSKRKKPLKRRRLTPEKRAQLRALQMNNLRTMAPLRAMQRLRKIELAIAVTANSPNMDQIKAKMEAVLAAKRAIMLAQIQHHLALTKIVGPKWAQRIKVRMLRSAIRGRRFHRWAGRHRRSRIKRRHKMKMRERRHKMKMRERRHKMKMRERRRKMKMWERRRKIDRRKPVRQKSIQK